MSKKVDLPKADAPIGISLGSIADEDSEEISISPSLITVTGKISDKDVAKALSLVTEHQIELLDKWSEIHDG